MGGGGNWVLFEHFWEFRAISERSILSTFFYLWYIWAPRADQFSLEYAFYAKDKGGWGLTALSEMLFNDTSTNCNHKDIFKNGHYHIAFNIILWYVDTLVFIKYVLFKTYTKTGCPYTIVVPFLDFSKFHTKNFCLPTRKPSTMEYGHPLLKFWEFSSKNTLSGRIP